MQITNQKRIAARLLKCGENRVWINPLYVDQVASAVQTDDIREFIDEGGFEPSPSREPPVSAPVPVSHRSERVAARDRVPVPVRPTPATPARTAGCEPFAANAVS